MLKQELDWSSTTLDDVSHVEIPSFSDQRGLLSLLDNNNLQLGFTIDRCFFLSDVAHGQSRASHANVLTQALVSIGGPLEVELYDGFSSRTYRLAPLRDCLIVPPGIWNRISGFGPDSVCVVLASGGYNPDEQIADGEELARRKTDARRRAGVTS